MAKETDLGLGLAKWSGISAAIIGAVNGDIRVLGAGSAVFGLAKTVQITENVIEKRRQKKARESQEKRE